MRYWLAIIITMLVFTGVSFCHPPTGVEMEFDSETRVLTVHVMHSVNKINKHYIYKVVVELNGKEIVTQTFKTQTDGATQEVMYIVVDAKVGDTIAVTGYCSISGKKKASTTVEELEE